ncbi:MAG: hypothetical protein WBM32_05140 [Crocosphaera sp.]
MKKSIFIIILNLIGITLVGCPNTYEWSCPTLEKLDHEKLSNPEKIFISIDGTPSMKGFVSSNNSRYIRTLRLLRNATTTAFPTTTSPDFYIFGTKRLNKIESENDRNVLVKVNNNSLQNVEKLIINSQKYSDNKQEILLKYTLDYSYFPYTLPLINSLESRINQSSDYSQGTKLFEKLESNNSSLPISIKNWEFTSNNQLQFNVKINLDNNSQKIGVHRLVFDILPQTISDKTKPYKAPKWWKDWSFGEQGFAGNKTYNLEPFLYSLGDTTFRIIENQPEFALGRLCFVIEKKG